MREMTRDEVKKICPAQAGVIPAEPRITKARENLSRASGGDPKQYNINKNI